MHYFGIVFLVMLFLEIMSIVWVADWLGGGITLLLMVASFALGIFMLRRMGTSGVLLAAAAMRTGGKVSLYQLLWPIRYAVAGVLLLSPGFVSMLAAVILMLPFKGKPVTDLGGSNSNMDEGFTYTAHSRHGNQDDVIEGEYTVTDGPEKKNSVDYLEDKSK
ncbi:FxsA family protein [Neisseria sp. 83E34]|uniref:FxsA family protein n=1 Tax=Neisseria sp. 83E34 TaxID=1692264 RepID=UPI0006CE75D8|nr:FxsA family protein [Neisseria sp. 83E34]KPN71923.1 exclusion suppressor FxsA [Neisseria sp. 83E34]